MKFIKLILLIKFIIIVLNTIKKYFNEIFLIINKTAFYLAMEKGNIEIMNILFSIQNKNIDSYCIFIMYI